MVAKLIVKTALWVAAMAALLFLPAGTVRWPGGWVFLAEMAISGLAVGLWLARHDPALLAERLSPLMQREQKRWDKILLAGIFALSCGWLIFMALDAARFGWSEVPTWTQGLGAVLILLSMYVSYLTFRENSYAAPVVKLQKERGQKVVTTGPYRYVRHPMYAGAIIFFLGAPLLLGSWYGLAAAPLLIAVLALRAVLEERMLAAELEGYAEYAKRVRYRLVPMLW